MKTPTYICEEKLLKNNLEILKKVKDKSGAKILLALKGYAMHSTFGLVSQYLDGVSASGLNEAKLGDEYFAKEVHTYSPAFSEDDIKSIIKISNHIIFNSFAQYQKYKNLTADISVGIRVNPQSSSVETELYNPCGLYSRLGVIKDEFRADCLDGVDGLHFHALCEQDSYALKTTLESFIEKFGEFIPQMKWVNFGGGHHITREDYNTDHLIEIIKDFKSKYNNIEVYLEPGEAIGWQVGTLVSRVLDIVHNGINIAILDTSAEAHMPDTLAMPYRPMVRDSGAVGEKKYSYRLAGNTCLAGDIIGDYSFDKALEIGDLVIFEDQIHYTFVKNTTFNGINLPSLMIQKEDGSLETIKDFGYDDYKQRLS